jgi:DNA-directed RNA polymerase beta' subunit
MAVHVPLSYEAQIEAATLMLASHNIFLQANRAPNISPSQEDMLLGLFYLTKNPPYDDNQAGGVSRGQRWRVRVHSQRTLEIVYKT